MKSILEIVFEEEHHSKHTRCLALNAISGAKLVVIDARACELDSARGLYDVSVAFVASVRKICSLPCIPGINHPRGLQFVGLGGGGHRPNRGQSRFGVFRLPRSTPDRRPIIALRDKCPCLSYSHNQVGPIHVNSSRSQYMPHRVCSRHATQHGVGVPYDSKHKTTEMRVMLLHISSGRDVAERSLEYLPSPLHVVGRCQP